MVLSPDLGREGSHILGISNRQILPADASRASSYKASSLSMPTQFADANLHPETETS
jgi:hypothetical protein